MEIQLKHGRVAIIDDADAHLAARYRWCLIIPGKRADGSDREYACTRFKREDGTKAMIYLHRAVLGEPPPGMVCDHINGNGLDNRRENLRFVSKSLNGINARKFGGKVTSKYKGVSLDKLGKKWDCRITINRKQVYLGVYATEEDAARRYDEEAVKHYGEHAVTNFGRR